jgi:hypothetical protein
MRLLFSGAEFDLFQANGSESSSYEPFSNSSNTIPPQNNLTSQTPLYQDTLSMGGAGFFPSQSGFQQPVRFYRTATTLHIEVRRG